MRKKPNYGVSWDTNLTGWLLIIIVVVTVTIGIVAIGAAIGSLL